MKSWNRRCCSVVHYLWDFAFLWKLRLPPRVLMLIWKLGHGKLLTNSFRLSCGAAATDLCPVCANHSETLMHIFRDCKIAAAVWNPCCNNGTIRHHSEQNFSDWLKVNLQSTVLLPNDMPWFAYFAMGLWSIWNWRCNITFNDEFVIPPNPDELITRYWKSWDAAKAQQGRITHPLVTDRRLVRWHCPPVGVVKLNVDGGRNEQSQIYAGGVVRDDQGQWIKGFSCNLGAGTVLLAECWAILLGLQLLEKWGFRQVVVEIDALEVVKLYHDATNLAHSCAELCKEMRRLSSTFNYCLLQHTYREANGVAHELALMGQFQSWGLKIIDVMPSCLSTIMLYDIVGPGTVR